MRRKRDIRFVFIVYALIVVYAQGWHIANFDRFKIIAPVEEWDIILPKDSIRPTILTYEHARIGSSPQIELIEPSLIVKLVAPSERRLKDTIYCLLILSLCIFCYRRLKNVDLYKPYSYDLGNTTKWVAYILLFFWLINTIRLIWFNFHVLTLTNDEYSYAKNVFDYIPAELWIGLVLFRLGQLIEKGETLQRDYDMTI